MMVIFQPDGSLVSDGRTAAVRVGTNSPLTPHHANLEEKRAAARPSYLAVLNGPECAVGVAILQSYVLKLSTLSGSTNICGGSQRKGVTAH